MCLLGLLLATNISIPIRINTYATELIWNDPSHISETTVTIRGNYRINLFRRYNEFRGTIIIGEYPDASVIYQHLQLTRGGINNFRWGVLMCYCGKCSPVDIFGVVYCNILLRNAVIFMFVDGSTSTGDAHALILRTREYDVARSRLKSLFVHTSY